jgi:hypothetical protein
MRVVFFYFIFFFPDGKAVITLIASDSGERGRGFAGFASF